jgi:hypothetical protein
VDPAPPLDQSRMKERRHRARMDETSRPESRRYQDANGVWWRVYEEPPADNTSDPQRSCLIFECDMAARRVYDFPPNWRQLEDEVLQAVSWRR